MRRSRDKESNVLEVLLVEDDGNHAEIVKRTLAKSEVPSVLNWVTNGEEAMAYLKGEEPYQKRVAPDIVLLDLKLPKKTGHEVIEAIRETKGISETPIVVLSTSDADPDLRKAYECKVNSYLVKPIEAKDFKDMINDFSVYWGRWNVSPPKS